MPTNLVTDPGFETGLTGWTVGGTPSTADSVNIGVDEDPSDVHSGSHGLFAGNDFTTRLSQTLTTVAGQSYNISFYLDVYQADATDGGLTLDFGGQQLIDLVEPSETDAFVLYTATAVTAGTGATLEFSFNDPPGFFGLDDVSVSPACFAHGTRIETDTGAAGVAALRVGDRLRLAGGGCAPIRWIGRTVVACAGHPNPASVRPFRIAPHAFGPGRPRRALLLSPDHAVLAEDVLIPIKYLANGTTIRQLPAIRVIYYHIELDRHDVVLAEGLPAESYLRAGARAFAEAGLLAHPAPPAPPGEACRIRDAAGCAPLVVAGAPIERTRRHLAVLARRLRHAA